MTREWGLLFLIISVKYAFMSGDFLLSLISVSFLHMILISFVFVDGSIVHIREVRPIVLNVTISLCLAFIVVFFDLYKDFFQFIFSYFPKISNTDWYNLIIIYLLLRAIMKLLRKLPKVPMVILLMCCSSLSYAANSTLLKRTFEYDALPETLFMSGKTHSFQVKGYPFFCNTLAKNEAQTYIKISRNKTGVHLFNSLLSTKKLPLVCKKLILEEIKKLPPFATVVNHNIDTFEQSGLPLFISIFYKKEGFSTEEFEDIKNMSVNSVNPYKGISSIFLLLFLIMYLYDLRLSRIKDYYDRTK